MITLIYITGCLLGWFGFGWITLLVVLGIDALITKEEGDTWTS